MLNLVEKWGKSENEDLQFNMNQSTNTRAKKSNTRERGDIDNIVKVGTKIFAAVASSTYSDTIKFVEYVLSRLKVMTPEQVKQRENKCFLILEY